MSKKFNKERLTGMFDQMSPSDEQKVRMREVISDHERRLSSRSHSSQRKVWLSTALLSLKYGAIVGSRLFGTDRQSEDGICGVSH